MAATQPVAAADAAAKSPTPVTAASPITPPLAPPAKNAPNTPLAQPANAKPSPPTVADAQAAQAAAKGGMVRDIFAWVDPNWEDPTATTAPQRNWADASQDNQIPLLAAIPVGQFVGPPAPPPPPAGANAKADPRTGGLDPNVAKAAMGKGRSSRAQQQLAYQQQFAANSAGRSKSRGGKGKQCTNCQGYGHLPSDCPLSFIQWLASL